METQSKAEEYRRVCLIATSKIPVSEESLVFNLFSARKQLAQNIKDGDLLEDNKEYVVEMLRHIENTIKEYLLL
jgi:hypothetical protein